MKSVIEPSRIGTGNGYFILAAGMFFIGLLLMLAESITFGTICFGWAVGAIAVGFWVRLFGLLEMRLMDIERRLAPQSSTLTESPETTAISDENELLRPDALDDMTEEELRSFISMNGLDPENETTHYSRPGLALYIVRKTIPRVDRIPDNIVNQLDDLDERALRAVIEHHKLDTTQLTSGWSRADLAQFIRACANRNTQ